MAEERRRRRGRRHGRGRGRPSGSPAEERRQEGPADVAQESDAPGVLPSRLRFLFGRGGSKDEKVRKRRGGGRKKRSAVTPAAVSPLSFWRSGPTRTYRKRPESRRGGLTLRRLRGLRVPPWVPVGVIIAVVFGILGMLFFVQSAAAGPRLGDHWHATYEIFVCGERQPDILRWEGGVHTHGDGFVHLHPQSPSEEGAGARLVEWFGYGGDALGTGAKLTKDELQIPGQREAWKNGDQCPDGTQGVLQVFVNGAKMDNWSRYIPQDGDQIRIEFGPEMSPLQEGIEIPVEEATREVSIEAGDQGQPALDSFFSPNVVTIEAGETVKLNVRNVGSVTHNLRITGVDQEYDTEDDFVVAPPGHASTLIKPGESGFTVVRIDEPGQYAFRCDIHPNVQLGTLIVRSEGSSPPEEEAP